MSASVTVLQTTIDQIREHVATKESDHQAAVRRARKLDQPEPQGDVPRASSAKWVRWASKAFRDADCDPFFADVDLQAAGTRLADLRVARLRELPEFALLEGHEIDLRWTTRAMVERDIESETVILGRPKVVPLEERLTWPTGDQPPSWRLTLSLPAAVLATTEELERGLHGLLCSLGLRDGQPVLRRPDIVGHTATLARFGTVGIRETLAVACAVRHPDTQERMREFGFDPATGQGLLYAPVEPTEVH